MHHVTPPRLSIPLICLHCPHLSVCLWFCMHCSIPSCYNSLYSSSKFEIPLLTEKFYKIMKIPLWHIRFVLTSLTLPVTTFKVFYWFWETKLIRHGKPRQACFSNFLFALLPILNCSLSLILLISLPWKTHLFDLILYS